MCFAAYMPMNSLKVFKRLWCLFSSVLAEIYDGKKSLTFKNLLCLVSSVLCVSCLLCVSFNVMNLCECCLYMYLASSDRHSISLAKLAFIKNEKATLLYIFIAVIFILLKHASYKAVIKSLVEWCGVACLVVSAVYRIRSLSCFM